MSLVTSVLHDGGIALLALSGELDLAVAGDLDDVMTGVLDDGRRRVVVDLNALRFCDSTGLGALVRSSRRVQAAGGVCVVAGAQGAVERLLVVTGMRLELRLEREVQGALLLLRASSDA